MDIRDTLSRMSLREKIDLCEGHDFWHTRAFKKHGIGAVMMCDGPHGLRKQTAASDMLGVNSAVPATCFPTAVAAGCSWDPELCTAIGKAIAEEARANEVSLVLGPGLNIKRNPLCGRNFEYYSEDPLLSGKLAAGFVRGVQSTGVGACLKHFAANSQEYKRFSSDSAVDERTLREIYLRGFEIAVKESSPAAVMNSYNKINGVHTGEDKWLLTDVLRREWGFGGIVMTDWGAMNDRVAAFRAGCDLNMPGGSGYQRDAVISAVKSGSLSESDLDRSAERMLRFIDRSEKIVTAPCDMQAHHELAKKAAAESAVLLKNGGALPIKGSACLIGHMANTMRYQGAGSSHINAYKLSEPTECMEYPYAQGCNADGSTTETLIDEAVSLARSVDTPVIFAGLPDGCESEGFDREHMRMPEGHIRMIEAVSAANPNTVVVLMCGSAVETPWIDSVNAVLYMGLPGQAGGEAIAELLFGKVNPSGKLSETWPLSYGDVVSRETFAVRNAEYREGVFVGYRCYDSSGEPVRFAFGHGLSYTSFEYSDLVCEGRKVSVTVKNSGEVAGAEVVQLYIRPPKGGIARPVRELRGFEKLMLRPGESRAVSFELTDRDFAVWSDGWRVQSGKYTAEVGGLRAEIIVDGEDVPVPPWQTGSWYETLSGSPSHADWLQLYGKDYSPAEKSRGSYDMDCSIMEMMGDSKLLRTLYKLTEFVVSLGFGGKRDYSDPAFRMMMSCSADAALRSLAISAKIPESLLRRLVKRANR